MAWEIVSATAFVPPGAPFAVDWTVDIEAVHAPGEQLPPMPADPEAPAGNDLLPPSIRQDAPSMWRDTLSVRRDNPAVAAELTVRIPTRDWAVPDMDFTLQHDHPQRRTQLSMYRALRGGALGIGGLEGWPGYFVTAADSLNFHWSHGATLRFTPGNGKRNRFSLSLFAERDAEIETDEERTRVGGALEWKLWWGAFGDGSVGGGGNVVLRGSLGDNSHAKGHRRGCAGGPAGLAVFARTAGGHGPGVGPSRPPGSLASRRDRILVPRLRRSVGDIADLDEPCGPATIGPLFASIHLWRPGIGRGRGLLRGRRGDRLHGRRLPPRCRQGTRVRDAGYVRGRVEDAPSGIHILLGSE